MSAGLGERFNILQQSPHDLAPAAEEAPAAAPEVGRWVASRYNIRATTSDGRLVLWNSYKGTMSVFKAEDKERIVPLLHKRGFEAPLSGIVEYLFKRGFLLKEGTDEYRRIQLGFGQQHYRTDTLQLILLASEDCNFRCHYCYEDFTRGTMLPGVREGIKNLVRDRSKTLRHLSISWFGGEPLYGLPAIEDLAPFFVETAEVHGINLSSSMTTNGYLLSPETAGKLLGWGILKYQITIDGTPEDHNRSRPARDGSETFDTILSNLVDLQRRAEKFSIDIRVNFDRKNYSRFGPFLDLLAGYFRCDPRFRLRFRRVGQWGGVNDEQLEVCGFNDSIDLQMELKGEAAKRGLNVSDDVREIKGYGSEVCYAARPYSFIVGATGKLMKCTVELDKNDRNVVGHIDSKGKVAIDTDKLARWTEPAFEQDSQCKKCVILPACQGLHCPIIRFDTGNSPCTTIRRTFKKEMNMAVLVSEDCARKVTVEPLQHS